jgi:hypothetical protein
LTPSPPICVDAWCSARELPDPGRIASLIPLVSVRLGNEDEGESNEEQEVGRRKIQ